VSDPGKIISSTQLISYLFIIGFFPSHTRLAIFFILESFPTPIWLIIMIGLNSSRAAVLGLNSCRAAAVLGLKFWKQKKKIDVVGNQMDMPKVLERS
jgi:hypothetical protein